MRAPPRNSFLLVREPGDCALAGPGCLGWSKGDEIRHLLKMQNSPVSSSRARLSLSRERRAARREKNEEESRNEEEDRVTGRVLIAREETSGVDEMGRWGSIDLGPIRRRFPFIYGGRINRNLRPTLAISFHSIAGDCTRAYTRTRNEDVGKTIIGDV